MFPSSSNFTLLAQTLPHASASTSLENHSGIDWQELSQFRVRQSTYTIYSAKTMNAPKLSIRGLHKIVISRNGETLTRIQLNGQRLPSTMPILDHFQGWKSIDESNLSTELLKIAPYLQRLGLSHYQLIETNWLASLNPKDLRLTKVLELKLATGHGPGQAHLSDKKSHKEFALIWSPEQQIILEQESLLRHVDATGQLQAMLPAGGGAYTAGVNLQADTLPFIQLSPTAFPAVITDSAGQFLIPNVMGSVLTVIDLSGPYFQVFNNAGAHLQYLGNIQSNSFQTILMSNSSTEESAAQVICAHSLGQALLFLEDHSPSILNTIAAVEAHVNTTGNCYAFYSSIFSAMYFTSSWNSCPNAAYDSIVAHEYFHHLAFEVLPASSLAVEEAMADVFAAYVTGNPIIGEHFYSTNSHLRRLDTFIQYPNPSMDAATEGLPLAQAFWRLRILLEQDFGQLGIDKAAEIWIASLATSSGQLHDNIVHEILLADDDDFDLSNGTPHYSQIIQAFSEHSFSIPLLPVSNLVCSFEETQSLLSWELPSLGMHTQLQVRRNGLPIAVLAANSQNYVDYFPPQGFMNYEVLTTSASTSGPSSICGLNITEFASFLRGDISGDQNHAIDDVLALLTWMFNPNQSYDCLDMLDVNDSGAIDLSDPVYLLQYLFLSGANPPAPFVTEGFDPTPDSLPCVSP